MKHVMKIGLFLSVMMLLTACINIPLGDGNKLKLSKDGLTFTDEDGDETSVSLDQEAGQLNITGGKDGEEIDLSIGGDVEIPDDFPKDIPLTADAYIFQAMKMVDGETKINVSYFTNESVEVIEDMYDNYVAGAFTTVQKPTEEENPYAGTEVEYYMTSAERDSGKIIITSISTDRDSGEESGEEYARFITIIFVPTEA